MVNKSSVWQIMEFAVNGKVGQIMDVEELEY